MSAANIQRIAGHFADRIKHVDRAPNPKELLAEFVSELARDCAEHVFFKVQTEPGWTQEEAQGLADMSLEGQVDAIVKTLHANGGTIEMAQRLAEAAASAFGARLAELTASYRHGGAA